MAWKVVNIVSWNQRPIGIGQCNLEWHLDARVNARGVEKHPFRREVSEV